MLSDHPRKVEMQFTSILKIGALSNISLKYRTLSSKQSNTIKKLMSSPKCRSVEVINNPAGPGSNHREVNCINYK